MKTISNKTKHFLNENKWNELSKKVEVMSTKGLTKNLINGCKILNGNNILIQKHFNIIQ